MSPAQTSCLFEVEKPAFVRTLEPQTKTIRRTQRTAVLWDKKDAWPDLARPVARVSCELGVLLPKIMPQYNDKLEAGSAWSLANTLLAHI